MAKVVCNPNKYLSDDGTTCCGLCPAGTRVHRVCDSTKGTECAECGRELFTATINYLSKCVSCTQCYANQREVKACLAHENRQCECTHGFYCEDHSCEDCVPVTPCPLGRGVQVKATATKNIVCAPCERGTFSDVSDDTSPCKTHASCEDQGRVLKSPGTYSADAVCGPFKAGYSWELPAGLWSGLVLTCLLMFLGLIFWRTKHKSRKTMFSSVPTDPVETTGLPVVQLNPPELPVPSPLIDIHCQESYDVPSHITADCNCCVLDNVGNGPQETHTEPTSGPNPFSYETSLDNGRPENLLETSLNFHSEPQEDEWSGT